MEDELIGTKHAVIEDKTLESILDAVDNRTAHQQILHNHISDGFMALARERYVNPSSSERLGRLVYDNRDDLQSSVVMKVDDTEGSNSYPIISRLETPAELETTGGIIGAGAASTLRRRGGGKETAGSVNRTEKLNVVHNDVRNRFMAIPSPEVRDAMKCFRMAVDQAIEVANSTRKVDLLIRNVE